MRRDVTIAVLLRAAAALSWLGYTWVLTRLLPTEELGVVLNALALSGLLAGVLAAGWVGRLLRDGARAKAELDNAQFGALITRALLAVIIFGAIAAVLMTVLAAEGYLPFFAVFRTLATLIGLIAVATATIGCLAAAQRARGALIRSLALQGLGRAVLPLALTAALAQSIQTGPVVALCLYLASLIALGLCLIPGLPRFRFGKPPRGSSGSTWVLWRAQAGGILYQNLDVLALSCALGAFDAAVYLVARRLACLLAVLFEALRSAVAPRLAVAYGKPDVFAALSARVNLGFLLFGAGGAGVLVLGGPAVLPLFGTAYSEAYPMMLWLVLGQAAPAVFGATGMLMVMADMERARARLVWGLCPPAFGLMLLFAPQGPEALAMCAALTQLGLGAASAVLLAGRRGVLPGATALLHTRLRLT